jgi:hypothetical protein
MTNANLALAEPMFLEAAPRIAGRRGSALALVSLLIGFSCATLSATFFKADFTEPAIELAWQRMIQSARASQALPPAKFAGQSMRSLTSSGQPLDSPFQRLALTAVAVASNRGDGVRVRASLDDSMDTETKEAVETLEKSVLEKAKEMAGVTGPTGFFDPLGFATDIDEGKLLFYREVEVKHGRVAMLASLGILVGEQFHPLFGGNIDVPSYVAFQQTPLQTFWPAVVAAIAIPEVFSVFTFKPPFGDAETGYAITNGWKMRSDRLPGDVGFDPLGLKPTDPTELKEMQTKELNNGRLAMIAAAGMIAQELATGQKLF